jgi:hypothetical protein
MILQILNSDFANPSTMGYRAFSIYKNSPYDISIFCRDNLSNIKNRKIKNPFPFYREYSRFAQFMTMINKNIVFLKNLVYFCLIILLKKILIIVR